MIEFLKFTVFCVTVLMICAMALRFISEQIFIRKISDMKIGIIEDDEEEEE